MTTYFHSAIGIIIVHPTDGSSRRRFHVRVPDRPPSTFADADTQNRDSCLEAIQRWLQYFGDTRLQNSSQGREADDLVEISKQFKNWLKDQKDQNGQNLSSSFHPLKARGDIHSGDFGVEGYESFASTDVIVNECSYGDPPKREFIHTLKKKKLGASEKKHDGSQGNGESWRHRSNKRNK